MLLVLPSINDFYHLLLHCVDNILLGLNPSLHQLQLLIHVVKLVEFQVGILTLALFPFSLTLLILSLILFLGLLLVVFFLLFEDQFVALTLLLLLPLPLEYLLGHLLQTRRLILHFKLIPGLHYGILQLYSQLVLPQLILILFVVLVVEDIV